MNRRLYETYFTDNLSVWHYYCSLTILSQLIALNKAVKHPINVDFIVRQFLLPKELPSLSALLTGYFQKALLSNCIFLWFLFLCFHLQILQKGSFPPLTKYSFFPIYFSVYKNLIAVDSVLYICMRFVPFWMGSSSVNVSSYLNVGVKSQLFV